MKNKRYWDKLVPWIICVVLAFLLYNLVRNDREAYAERIAQYQLQASQSVESDTEMKERLTDIYDQFYAQVDVRNIICWGDSAMAGNSQYSLPSSLKKVVEENLFASLKKAFNRVFEDGEFSTPSVTVNNMGVTNEGMRQIFVRAGVNSIELGEAIDIPAGKENVTVRLMDQEAWDNLSDKNPEEQLKFANQKNVSFGKVYINGVRGSLVAADDWFDSGHPRYAFVRKDEGDPVRANARTEVEIETATKYLGDIPVFFFEDASGKSIDTFVDQIEQLVNRYAYLEKEDNVDSDLENTDSEAASSSVESSDNSAYDLPFVVICTTEEDTDLDKAMEKRFKDHYIRNDNYSNEMTDRTYKKLAKQVYDSLNSQGCFADVQAQITTAIQEAEGL